MSDIIVRFKPKGHPDLIKAIERLNSSQGKAIKSTKQYTSATKKVVKSQKKFTLETGRNRKAMSLFENSLSTIRSKLLVYNFLLGLGVKQMVDMARQGAKLQNLERGFTNLAKGSASASAGISKLSAATQGTVDNFGLFKQANNAMILGVTKNTDEMAEMFNMAKRLGDALGVDTAHAVESLITGIGRQSRLMLDNIGIIVKADEAYSEYASKLGKTTDELTNAEKKQAFLNAALDAARQKVASLGPQTKQVSDQFAQFSATMSNMGTNIGSFIAPALGKMAETISNFIDDLGKSDLEKIRDDLIEIGVAAADIALINQQIDIEKATNRFMDSTDKLVKGYGEFVDITDIPLSQEELKQLGFSIQSIMVASETNTEAFSQMNEEFRDARTEAAILSQDSGFLTSQLSRQRQGTLETQAALHSYA